MELLDVLSDYLRDWHKKSHQKWLEDLQKKQQQQNGLLAFQIAQTLPDELAIAFGGKNYAGSVSIHNTGDFYFEKYFFRNGKPIFEFVVRKSIACDLPATDLSLIRRQMNQDIAKFKQDVYFYEGEETLAVYYPCLYQGACVARVANSPRSERELLLYII